MRTLLLAAAAALALAACETTSTTAASAPMAMEADSTAIAAAVAAQSADTKARYTYRNPAETLEFMGLRPGMTVVDVLPGAGGKGWYTPILARVLGANGADGKLVGVDYSLDMWPEFGGFADAEFIASKKFWAEEWVEGAENQEAGGVFGATDIEYAATTLGNPTLRGEADAVLFMRALHNLSRFEEKGGYLTQATQDAYTMLRPGGVVGVVQHRAPEASSDDWAVGSAGYVKQSAVIAAFEAAGFELEATSEINANALDVPSETDVVWRLLPSLRGDEATKAAREAIGESDRMTLRFRKPA